MVANVNNFFQAQWNPHNEDLKPDYADSLPMRIAYLAKEILLFIPRFICTTLCNYMIIPVFFAAKEEQEKAERVFEEFWQSDDWKTLDQESYDSMNKSEWFQETKPGTHGLLVSKQIRKTYKAKPVNIKTADGETLKGHHFQHKNRKAYGHNAKVMLVFEGSDGLYQNGKGVGTYMKSLYDKDIPYSFISVSPRGVMGSTGRPSSKGLELDADAAYQYARHLGYTTDNILISGYSLGSGAATDLKLRYPSEAPLILDRPISSVDDKVETFAGYYNFPVSLAQGIVHFGGWRFDNYDKVSQIESKVYVLNLEVDETIFPIANLAKKIIDNNVRKQNHFVRDDLTTVIADRYDMRHSVPLSHIKLRDGSSLVEYLENELAKA